MSNLFRFDGKLIQKLSTVGNLIILNMLWVLFSLPIITAGAATTAMYHVVFQYIYGETDNVWIPFVKDFLRELKKSTLLTLLFLIVGAVLFVVTAYVYGNWTRISILGWTSYAVVILFFAIPLMFAFPLMGRYNTTIPLAIKNSYYLFFTNLGRGLLVMLLNILPVVCIFVFRVVLVYTGVLWVMIGFSFVAYCCGKLYVSMYRKVESQTEVTT